MVKTSKKQSVERPKLRQTLNWHVSPNALHDLWNVLNIRDYDICIFCVICERCYILRKISTIYMVTYQHAGRFGQVIQWENADWLRMALLGISAVFTFANNEARIFEMEVYLKKQSSLYLSCRERRKVALEGTCHFITALSVRMRCTPFYLNDSFPIGNKTCLDPFDFYWIMNPDAVRFYM